MSELNDSRPSWLRWLRDLVTNRQTGQSLILFALMLTTLVAGTGLVIDTGYAFQQRRLAQNAADSAALAAAQYLAQNRMYNVACSQVQSVIQQYVNANLPNASFSGTYVSPGGSTWGSFTSGSTPGCTISQIQSGQNPSVVGVTLSVTHTHNTFFMRAVSLNTVTVQGQATAEYGGSWTVPIDYVLPIILDDQQWSDLTGQSVSSAYWTVSPESPAINSSVAGCPEGYFNVKTGTYETSTAVVTYQLDITTPISCGGTLHVAPEIAGFDWGPLNTTCNGSSCSNSDSNIKCLMQLTCVQSTFAGNVLSVGDYVQISGGVRDVNFFNYLQSYAAGRDMLVPLVSHQDIVKNACPNCAVPVKGFAWIHVVKSFSNGSNSYFTAAWDDPSTTLPLPGAPGAATFQAVSAALVK